MIKTLYTDAGFTWQDTEKSTDGVVYGKICITDDAGFEKVELVGVGKVPELQQYINVFELIAIARAIEYSLTNGWTDGLAIYTDSAVARGWASKGRTSKEVSTEAHKNAVGYLVEMRKQYPNTIAFHHVLREVNPAGLILEKELEKRIANGNKPYHP